MPLKRKYSHSKKNPGEMFLVTEGMKQGTVIIKQEYEVLNADVPINVTGDTSKVISC